VAALVVAGCASSPAPSATPASAGTPGQQGEQSAVVPTPVPGAATPAAGGLVVTAVNIDFQPKQLAAPAGVPFTITLVNQDAGVPHNLTVFDPAGRELASSEVVTGPTKTDVRVQAVDPGSYTFQCKVHPNMAGTLVVGG
jgi:plastocyanin